MAASSGPALGFLRRLLCAHTAAASSSPAPAPARRAPPEEGRRSPCIVARLMGLDAMPPPPRRARPSLRDKPAYLRPENDAFLLLSFSPEERGTGRESAHDDVGAERRRESRPPRRRKLRFGGGGDEAGSSSLSSSGSARRECNAQQSSSPASVLDARDESSTTTTATSSSLEDVEPCSATSEETRFTLEQHSSSSTRKPQTSFVQVRLDDTTPATSTVHASRCSDRDRRNRRVVNQSEARATGVAATWQPICTLVEEHLKSTEWATRDGGNISAEMGSGILDQLICEATAELVQLSSHASPLAARVPETCSDKASDWRYLLLVGPRNMQSGKSRVAGC